MRMVLSALAMVALVGCAIAPARYIDPKVSAQLPGTHVVSVERGKQLGASSSPLTIFIDGSPVAEVFGGQVINLYLKDGRHSIGVGMFGRTGKRAPEREITIDVSETSKPILRAGTVALGYGGWGIEPVSR